MKKVALFNDLSGFGKCSLTAAIPVLSALGITCHPIPTAVLTGQSGYPYFHCKDLTEMLPKYIDAWSKNHASFDAVYSGYLTGPKQIDFLFEFLEVFFKKNMFFLVDPVLGDNGKVYGIFSDNLLQKMKLLSQKATMITPNLTEACLLSGTDYNEISSLTDKQTLFNAVKDIGKKLYEQAHHNQEVIITGIKTHENNSDYIYNVAMNADNTYTFRSHLFDKSFSGTGDLFASCMCGLKLNGHSTEDSMKIAGKFLYHSIADTMNEFSSGNDGILFESHLYELMKEGIFHE